MSVRGNKFLKFFWERWDLGNSETQDRFKYSAGSGRGVILVAFTKATPEKKAQIIVIDEFQPNTRNLRSCIGCGVNEGEDLEVAAVRGLLNKTGFYPGGLTPITTAIKDIAYTYDTMTVFCATDCEPSEKVVDGVTLMDPQHYVRELMDAVTEDPFQPNDTIYTRLALLHVSDMNSLGLFR